MKIIFLLLLGNIALCWVIVGGDGCKALARECSLWLVLPVLGRAHLEKTGFVKGQYSAEDRVFTENGSEIAWPSFSFFFCVVVKWGGFSWLCFLKHFATTSATLCYRDINGLGSVPKMSYLLCLA